jgi:hypothetical protein
MRKVAMLIAGITLLMPLFIGCEKTDEQAPKLPPYGSMFIDFSTFKVQTKLGNADLNSVNLGSVTTNQNWTFAAGNVVFWNVLLTINLVVPVTAFSAAISQEPTYLGKAKWEWTYNLTGLLSAYAAHLTGEIRENDIKWEMYITNTGTDSFTEFKWFEGTSDLDGKGGQWILYHSYQFPEPLLQIDWMASGEDAAEIKYTYVRELNNNREVDPFYGSHLTYGLQESYYNAYYYIHFWEAITQQFVDVDIEWNTTLYYGHVKALHRFQDLNWHCWDNHGMDIDCTQ